MRICWDEKRIIGIEDRLDRLEKKVDNGFAETRADFRMILGVVLAMFLTMVLGLAGILLQLS
jgi:tetrahydromethanopterin S-methyltransferase subunit G